MSTVYIEGVDNVMANLNKEILAIQGRTLQGLIEAAIVIRRDMDITPPLIPIDLGNLRGSYSMDAYINQGNPVVTMQFTASYAWWVHENVGANFQRPGSGAKFFESALKRNTDTILAKVRAFAKIAD